MFNDDNKTDNDCDVDRQQTMDIFRFILLVLSHGMRTIFDKHGQRYSSVLLPFKTFPMDVIIA